MRTWTCSASQQHPTLLVADERSDRNGIAVGHFGALGSLKYSIRAMSGVRSVGPRVHHGQHRLVDGQDVDVHKPVIDLRPVEVA
jgi:hypothetical protein